MWIAEITFPSGFRFHSRIVNLETAMYFARVFGCNVFVLWLSLDLGRRN